MDDIFRLAATFKSKPTAAVVKCPFINLRGQLNNIEEEEKEEEEDSHCIAMIFDGKFAKQLFADGSEKLADRYEIVDGSIVALWAHDKSKLDLRLPESCFENGMVRYEAPSPTPAPKGIDNVENENGEPARPQAKEGGKANYVKKGAKKNKQKVKKGARGKKRGVMKEAHKTWARCKEEWSEDTPMEDKAEHCAVKCEKVKAEKPDFSLEVLGGYGNIRTLMLHAGTHRSQVLRVDIRKIGPDSGLTPREIFAKVITKVTNAFTADKMVIDDAKSFRNSTLAKWVRKAASEEKDALLNASVVQDSID